MSKLKISYVQPSQVDRTAVEGFENLAQAAWTEDLKATRTPEEVAFRFNGSSAHIDEVGPTYADFAKHGNLVKAELGGYLVGFAMARKDVSPKDPSLKSLSIRTGKRIGAFLAPKHWVHAWLYHISVDPAHWREGIGSHLLHDTYEVGFPAIGQASAYAFDEDPDYKFDEQGRLIAMPAKPFTGREDSSVRTAGFLKAMTFRLQVGDENRKVKTDYFGPGSKPVVQYPFRGMTGKISDFARFHAAQHPHPGI